MAHVVEVDVSRYDPAALQEDLPAGRWDHLRVRVREALGEKTLWHVNSTAAGGGVAEMLHPMIGLARSVGLSARWLVVDAPSSFFDITKRVDNGLSGIAGDGGQLGAEEERVYADVSRELVSGLARYVRPGDCVMLHDPQTAGLCEGLRGLGATVVWRAHNGSDERNAYTERAWAFLVPHLRAADGLVATMDRFRPPAPEGTPYTSIAPFIDPTAKKNIPLSSSDVRSRLQRWGIIAAAAPLGPTPPGYELFSEGAAPTAEVPMVVQVSRWDRVKDMAGVIDSFESSIAPYTHAHLTLAGPEVTGVADDPEAADYLAQCVRRWRQLPHDTRQRVHLVCLPMADMAENALTVNALQRHATVVTQKSRSEGFGLTVAEAMWKRTPVVATAVGGIQLQIPSPAHGVTVPVDGEGDQFGVAVRMLLEDSDKRRLLGERGREHIRTHFLPDTQLVAEIRFFQQLSTGVMV